MDKFVEITAIFGRYKKTEKKHNYSHLTGYNLLPTDADGIISPDIFSMVHKTMVKIVYSKQFLP